MVLIRSLLILAVLAASIAHSAYAQQFTLKFATLIPPDTAWMNEINNWADDVYKKSDGRLVFKIYPGGVMGDEPDVLRKIRINQLQGAFFTGYGIGRIFPAARVLEMPFLFKNTAESDYVRQQLMPDIENGFRENGYELIGWPEVGFIHFFSKHPINSLEELKTRKIWMWQGDPLGEAFTEVTGIAHIPLSIIDVYTQLSASHSSIDTVYNSTFGTLALQWHTKLKYASNVPMTNAIGSLLVSNEFFNKLPDDLKILLKTSGIKTAQQINDIVRRDNHKSIDLLKQSGIEFMWDWNEKEYQTLLEIRDKAAEKLSSINYIPKSYFDRTRKLLNEYRATQANK